jgi:adenosylhomocysteine nucleosidase
MPRRKIAIVAAMEREVKPLVRNWARRTIDHEGRQYQIFESGEAALVCGGIGAGPARRAAQAVMSEVNPARVVSVGFAGALNSTLAVGDIIEPRVVINFGDGVRTDTGTGSGFLISTCTVADKEQKVRLAKAYGASAVDMEAAAVAQAAEARGVEFGALKAISDAADFNLPAMDGFVAADGTFHSVRFACHVALRPWLWGSTMALARNSAKASRALCEALQKYLGHESQIARPVEPDSLLAASNQINVASGRAEGK